MERYLIIFLLEYKTFLVNSFINSCPFLMNYGSFYSFCKGLLYNIIVHMNKLGDHGTLPSYISSGI